MMLPDFDGIEVLRRMRTIDPGVPVLFLTARDAVEDRVAGLTAGGDDYVTKPFSLEELVARLRGPDPSGRRAGDRRSTTCSTVGDLTLDEDSHEVFRGGEEITLTATEFELLRFLMRNPRRVLSKAQILDRVWNYDFGGQANVVELYISYLRKKIDAGREPMIHTMRGAGYVLKPPAARPEAGDRAPTPLRSLTGRLVAHRRWPWWRWSASLVVGLDRLRDARATSPNASTSRCCRPASPRPGRPAAGQQPDDEARAASGDDRDRFGSARRR